MKKLMMTVLAAGMAAAAWADAHISYSGQLRAANGEPLTGKTTGNIEFRLYDVPTGSKVPLWARDIAVQIDANGCFAVELHDGAGSEVQGNKPTEKKSLDDVIANNANLYLGLTVKGSSGEINPRQKLLSNPRAVFAENVSLAKGNFTVTGLATLSGGIAAGDNNALKVSKAGKVEVNGQLDVKSSATFVKGATFSEGATFPKGLSVTGGTYGVMPIGTIVMWYGAAKNVPAGWAICDGKKHEGKDTPNLCGRFPIGADADEGAAGDYAVNKMLGNNQLMLTEKNIPPHTHPLFFYMRGVDGGSNLCLAHKNWDDAHEKYKPSTLQNTNRVEAVDNRPSYTALYFIMRVN